MDPKAQPSFRGYLDNVEQTYWPNIHVYELCLETKYGSRAKKLGNNCINMKSKNIIVTKIIQVKQRHPP